MLSAFNGDAHGFTVANVTVFLILIPMTVLACWNVGRRRKKKERDKP